MRPNQQAINQTPIGIYAGWDKVGDILSVLNGHDYGIFRNSAILVDAMHRDDRVRGVMNARLGSIMASPIEHKPANKSRKANKIAESLGGSEDAAGVWDLIFPSDVMRSMLKWSITMGFCVCELVWYQIKGLKAPGTNYDMWIPRIIVWHPQFVYWDWGTFTYQIITANGVISLPKISEQMYSDGKWFVYCPDGYQYGWLSAAVRSLAMLYIQRGWGNRDWSRHSEVQGIAIRKAFVPEAADETDKNEFFSAVSNTGGELTVMCPVGSEGRDKSYDVAYEEAKARTWECFKDLIAGKNVDIAVDLLGQNLTTEVQSGSLAAAQIQNQVRLDIRQGDAKIAMALRAQVLTWWAEFNFGSKDLAPRSTFMVEPPEDELAEGASYKALGDGIQSLQAAVPRVDAHAILDLRGIPMRSQEELDAEEAIAREKKQKLFAEKPPQGGGTPDDGTSRGGVKIAGDEYIRHPRKKRDGDGDGEIDEKLTASLSSRTQPAPGPVKRYEFQQLPIAVENIAGSVRTWYEPGKAQPMGSTKMLHDYGYIEGHMGADGDDVDVYVGPDASAADVFVVHQLHAPDYKRYDEDKVLVGFATQADAKAAYVAHRNDGEQAIQAITSMPVERFRKRLLKRTSSGKIHASTASTEETIRALAALSNRAAQKTATLRTVAGNKRSMRYADRLTENAKKLAVQALAVDLKTIKGEIDKATSFEDLKARIVSAYKNKMNPAELARVVQKANLMANLFGRLQAVESL